MTMPIIKQINADQTLDLRHRIMSPAKSQEAVRLEKDSEGQHFGVFEEDTLVSVVSLFAEGQTAQFRKFATETSYQGKGYGGLLMEHILEESRAQNMQSIWCNARVSAIGFYEKYGLKTVGESYMNGDIAYIKMARDL
jgi:predicted GNAT family N-acyltransferase